jgi:cytoskeleton protein RodZ
MKAIKLIGTFLKTAREKKNISIEQISQKTKINVNILKALEDNNIEKLPNLTYVKGFVKNYAIAVGVDVDEAKACLDHTYSNDANPAQEKKQDTKKAQKPSIQPTEPSKNNDQDHNNEHKELAISFIHNLAKKKYIFGAVVLIVFVTIVNSVVTWIGNINAEKLEVEKQVRIITEPVLKSESSNILKMNASKKFAKKIVMEEVAKKAVVKINKKPIVKKEIVKEEKKEVSPEENKKPAVEKKAVVKLAPGTFPFKRFSPAPLKMYSTVSDSTEAKDESLLPNNIKASLVAGLENVYIVAQDDDTWISYQVDGKPIKRYVLKKGRRVLIKGEKVLLFIGNYNVARIFYNNKLVEAKTRTGVKSLIFPLAAAKDHMLPLFPSYKGIPYKAAEYIAKMVSETI